MALTKYPPNTIHLAGGIERIGDVAASEAITPGMLVERFNSAGVAKFRKHATAAQDCVKAVALDQNMLNKGVDDAYAAGDLMEVGILPPGSTAWMLVASGQNIVHGQRLESAGNGTLRAIAAGKPLFAAVENKDNSAGPANARIRVEAL